MPNTRLAWGLVLCLLFAACGSSDGGAPPDAAPDAAAVDAPDVDAGPSPVGTRLAGGLVRGVTSDDYAVVVDNSSVSAVSLAGGTPQKIADITEPRTVGVFITGRVALVSTGGLTPMYAWTATTGAVKLADASRPAASAAPQVSVDGQYVVFLANVTSTSADLVGAKVDGTARMTLVTGVDPNNSGIHWVGQYVVTTHATSMSGGVYTFDVASWNASAGWAQVALTSTAHGIHGPRGDVGTAIVVNEGTDSLAAYPVAGGSPTTLDTGATAEVDVLDDGVTVYYETSGGALKKTTVAGGTPVSLLQSGFDTVAGYARQYSPNVSVMLYVTPDLKMANANDYALVSLVSPTAPTVFLGHVGAHAGDYFTPDSAYAFLITSDTPLSAKTVAVVPTAGGSAMQITNAGSATIRALGSARIVYGGEEQMVTFPVLTFPQTFSYTLHVRDLASSATPSTIVEGAAGLFFTSSAKDKLVYTWLAEQTDPRFGTYVTQLP
jgi:hypothetical protein